MRRFNAAQLFLLLPRMLILRRCDTFVINFTAAEFRALHCSTDVIGENSGLRILLQSHAGEVNGKEQSGLRTIDDPGAGRSHPLVKTKHRRWLRRPLVPAQPARFSRRRDDAFIVTSVLYDVANEPYHAKPLVPDVVTTLVTTVVSISRPALGQMALGPSSPV
ncbi:hypothetical protein EVAR_89047_1 [Eumeta japonica]|uniref:Secreted protein n=1 Tax=Eumeta variegata TaxID=151549 RepID=A0A4C1Z4U9_EUMVA|nr:hypothetical protein EVAR_89047_1 [Eumeta japonica]